MSTLTIKDLPAIEELDLEQMSHVRGGTPASQLDNPVFISVWDAWRNAGYDPAKWGFDD